MRPFAIVTISNTVLAISAAVVLGISAYVEHAVSQCHLISLLMLDRYSRRSQLYLHLRRFRRSFHYRVHPRSGSLEGHQAHRRIIEGRDWSFCPFMGSLAW